MEHHENAIRWLLCKLFKMARRLMPFSNTTSGNRYNRDPMHHSGFLDIPERTTFSDEAYGIIGRALCVAQHFESNCKSIAMLLDIKGKVFKGELHPLDSDDFVKTVSKLSKRTLGGTLIHLKKEYGLPEDLNDILDEGRKARNDLAHSVSLGFEHIIESEDGRSGIEKQIKDLVGKIAEADKIIAILIQVVNKDEVPTKTYIDGYPDSILEWVCQTYDD